MSLMGLAGLGGGVNQVRLPPRSPAEGGTIYETPTQWIHVFTSPGDIIFSRPHPAVNYLLVGGGGYGGSLQSAGGSGGGGAGGLLTGVTSVTSGTFPVGIGTGGTNSPLFPVRNGGSTTALGMEAFGGGFGGEYSSPPFPRNGYPGGSGGGGCGEYTGGSGGNGVPGQGFGGGTGLSSPTVYGPFAGAGGGGAGGPGSGASGNAGPGGQGLPIPWIPSDYGTSGPAPGRWFAGGGGGSVYPTYGSPGTGGAGGGGNGYPTPGPYPAIEGTGTGGGGAGGRPGGSGIFAIAIPK